MRRLFILVLVGICIAGIGQRVAKRLHAAPAHASQTAAATSSGPSRDGSRRAAERPGAAQPGSGKLALTADRDGHFRVSALVNGRHMNFMVDTGATVLALTQRDADRLGLSAKELRGRTALISTANGSVTASSVRLDTVEVGDLAVRGVEAVVMPDGKLGENLLGMSYLSRLGRFEIRRGVLVLEQ